VTWRINAWLAKAPTSRFLQAFPDECEGWARASVSPLLRLIDEQSIDAIYSTYSPASNHLLALLLKQQTSLPWVADFRDLWTEDFRYKEPSKSRREADRTLWASRQRLSDDPIPGTFVYSTFRAIHEAGGRFRGSPFIRVAENPETSNQSSVFYVPKDDRLLGYRSFNLDKLEGDDTYQREKTCLWIGEWLEVPFFHQRHVNLYINEFKKGLKEVKDNFDDDGDDEPPKKKLNDSQQSDPIIEDKAGQREEDPVQTTGSKRDDQ
ncbi:MAG: hypothetical protein IID33_14740, partial [Planctomycetes bacterium]|nr:hypothetical protein [Planctomycetota bacterium]